MEFPHKMAVTSIYGVVCQLVWLSSLAFDDHNQISVLLSTPRFVTPSHIGICFSSPEYSQTLQKVAVKSVDSLWTGGWREELQTNSNSGWQESVEGGSPRNLLNSDAFYDSRHYVDKFDDLLYDELQQQLPPDMFQGATQLSNSTTDSRRRAVWQSSRTGQCMVVAGKWQANTVYLLNISVTNPRPPTATTAQNTQTPELWMVPLTTKQLQATKQGAPAGMQLLVRGSKYGQLCKLRPKAAAVLPRMFSPCEQVSALGLTSTGSSSAECLAALRSALASNNTALSSQFPFTVPPLVDTALLNASTQADTSCPPGQALSSWFGGECISCGNGTLDASGSRCICYPGYTSSVAGPSACGPALSEAWNVSSAAELAQQLCTQYSRYPDLMQQGLLADRLVSSMYLGAFQQQAAYLLDQAAVQEAAEVFWKTYVPDERMPASPTRRGRGIGPDCKSCRHGLFKDIYSKEWVPVRDDRFLAVNTLRLIGSLLNSTGSPCRALWDPEDPLKWMYGRYDKTMCVA